MYYHCKALLEAPYIFYTMSKAELLVIQAMWVEMFGSKFFYYYIQFELAIRIYILQVNVVINAMS
jgi:hypothetical protein